MRKCLNIGLDQLFFLPININYLCFIFLFVCCFSNNQANCPSNCECKWKSGKESVICTNLNLTVVPKNLDSSTQVLDLTGNLIESLKEHEFFNLNLINLQKMYISKCRLTSIDKRAFYKLINLVELDLSDNLLDSVPSESFEFIAELRELRLNDNLISRIRTNAFSHVPQLVRLEMSRCKIKHIERNAFDGLENTLEVLKLNDNKLVNLNGSAIMVLINLNNLDLMNNPWNCSCHVKPLRLWLSKQNIPFSVPPTCHYPQRLANKTWDKLELDDFACKPRIRAVSASYTAKEGSNITLACKFSGEPSPNITWTRRNKLLAHGLPNNLSFVSNRKLFSLLNEINTSYLTILLSEISDSGDYFCGAENRGGKIQAILSVSVIKTLTNPDRYSLIQNKTFIHVLFFCLLVILIFIFVFIYTLVFKRRIQPKYRGRLALSRSNETYDKIELNNCGSSGANKPTDLPAFPPKSNILNSVHDEKSRHPKLKQYMSLPISPSKRHSLLSPQVNYLAQSQVPYRDAHVPENEPIIGREESLDVRLSQVDRRISDPERIAEERREQAIRCYYEENFGEVTLQHHVLRKEKLPIGNLYTTLKQGAKTFPDLLESSPPVHSERKQNIFSTLPRVQSHSSQSSHSRSPLLPSSSQASSLENSSGSSRYHLMDLESSNYHKRNSILMKEKNSSSCLNLASEIPRSYRRCCFENNPSLPTSPVRYQETSSLSKRHSVMSETPILNILEPNRSGSRLSQHSLSSASRYQSSIAQSPYDSHAVQLERFLEEYRTLQAELTKMKESCDHFASNIDKDKLAGSDLVGNPDFLNGHSTKSYLDPDPPRSILKNRAQDHFPAEKSAFLQDITPDSSWSPEPCRQYIDTFQDTDVNSIYYDS